MGEQIKDKFGGIQTVFDTSTGHFNMTTDISAFKQQAQLDRDMQDYYGKNKTHRKMATIPNAVIYDMIMNHDFDLMSVDLTDAANKKRLRYILTNFYPDLIVNT